METVIDNKKMWESILRGSLWSSGTIFDLIKSALKEQGLEWNGKEIVSIDSEFKKIEEIEIK